MTKDGIPSQRPLFESAELPSGYQIVPLTKELAIKHIKILHEMIDTIPQVTYTPEMILAESKEDGRQFFNKWEHSLLLMHGNDVVGVVIGYERKSEGSNQYPNHSIYVSELAIAESYRGKGLAKKLLTAFFDNCRSRGMLTLDGPLTFSIQTNAAEFNRHVVNLYQSFGFKQRATKKYDNRTDVVLGWDPADNPEV